MATTAAGEPGTRLPGRIRGIVRDLAPGYFALVMGSGIISVGLHLVGFEVLSMVLAWICGIAYALLVVLHVWRLLAFRAEFFDEFNDPRRGFGFFTFVAGTNVLGVRLALEGWMAATAALLVMALLAWLLLGYVVPWTAVLGRTERPVVALANGTWFIWVVASQSIAVASASLQPAAGPQLADWLAVLAVVSWSVGIFLYALAGVLVALRMMLYELRPVDLNAPYWVAMGACAITVLAGARILEMADAPMIAATRGLISGVSVAFWAFATWLIPPLVAAGWWRHWHHKVPLEYEATLWSIVFPLGMYAVAGIYLGQADQLPVVGMIGAAELWVALAVWALVFVAMAVHEGRRLSGRTRAAA
ncbi:Tellurite resistance protein TehA [Agrococcus baldri]|uniref:Tellurite resistance protein TehA n=1 Tax=Agrococcus baldri TaxID=153730 RepID=A0AA94KZA4_9MICO|nr:tellurite resistance/C4-dicarboxylate transporter family protein [Agrococcus baldri]SFS08886.1 Tellurite resistance protein TehA [Agrococcus baldri]